MLIILRAHKQFWIQLILVITLILAAVLAGSQRFLGIGISPGILGLLGIVLGSLMEIQFAEFRAPTPKLPSQLIHIFPGWIQDGLRSGVIQVPVCLNLGFLILLVMSIFALRDFPPQALTPLPLVLGASLVLGYVFSEQIQGWGISIPGYLGIFPGIFGLVLGLDSTYIPGYSLSSGICLGIGGSLRIAEAKRSPSGPIFSLGGLRSLDGILSCVLVGGLISLI